MESRTRMRILGAALVLGFLTLSSLGGWMVYEVTTTNMFERNLWKGVLMYCGGIILSLGGLGGAAGAYEGFIGEEPPLLRFIDKTEGVVFVFILTVMVAAAIGIISM